MVEFLLRINGISEALWFSYDDGEWDNFDVTNANTFVSSVLLPAMSIGEDIDVNGNYLSKKFLDSIGKIQNQYLLFFPEKRLRKVKILNFKTKSISSHLKTPLFSNASFFTCGVDSFDTLINKNNIIDKLIYVYGFDVNRKDRELIRAVNKQFKIISKSFGKEFIFITTNLREFSEKYITWDAMHGSALVAIGYLFECAIKTIIIPGGNSPNLSIPSGSHPYLEPNFSSEKINFVCDGSNKKRIDKIINIKQSKVALENLRVCWKNAGNQLNCGVCEKCVRTMLGLKIAGAPDHIKTFSHPLDDGSITSIRISNDIVASFYREMLPYLKGQSVLDEAKIHLTHELNRFDCNDKRKKQPKSFVKNKNVLFIDFNGVISYRPFWFSLSDPKHKHHQYFNKMEKFLFRENSELVKSWMLGKYSSEQIHRFMAKKIDFPYKEVIQIFIDDCRNLDISKSILEKVKELRQYYYCVLATDNMDSFSRFTMISNPEIKKSFNEINNSSVIGMFKSEDNGRYFNEKIAQRKAVKENCILIDDSENNCNTFRSINGQAYNTKNEDEVLKVLDKILKKVKNKWEWQY
jgi:hypothetical protein